MRSRPDQDLDGAALDMDGRRRIADTLGTAPREALSALAGYGLQDHDIARHHGLPHDLVTELREFWRIRPNP
ncbi:hypothetical protein [Roseicyclus sp.]